MLWCQKGIFRSRLAEKARTGRVAAKTVGLVNCSWDGHVVMVIKVLVEGTVAKQ